MSISGETIMQESYLRGVIKGAETLFGQITTNASLTGVMSAPSGIINNDYEGLINKPQINGVELVGNKSFNDIGITGLTNLEIEDLLDI